MVEPSHAKGWSAGKVWPVEKGPPRIALLLGRGEGHKTKMVRSTFENKGGRKLQPRMQYFLGKVLCVCVCVFK